MALGGFGMRDDNGSLPPTPERLPARKDGKDRRLVDWGQAGFEIVVGRMRAKGWIT